MLAGGTGIAPMLQIIRSHLLYERKKGLDGYFNMSLIFACKDESEILLRSVIEEHMKKHSNTLSIYYSLLEPPKDWNMGVGFINEQMIKERMPQPGDCIIVICGPPPFCKAMVKILDKLGYSKDQYFSYL